VKEEGRGRRKIWRGEEEEEEGGRADPTREVATLICKFLQAKSTKTEKFLQYRFCEILRNVSNGKSSVFNQKSCF
jgi:hypothetical protein